MALTTAAAAIERLQKVDKLLNDSSSPVFEVMSTILGNSVSKNFVSGGRPTWPERRFFYPWAILVKSGNMEDMALSAMYDWKHTKRMHTLEAQSAMSDKGFAYGAYHQFGSPPGNTSNTPGKMPLRPYVQPTDQERQEILESISRIVMSQVWGK